MTEIKNVPTSILAIDFLELASETNNVYKTISILGRRANQVSRNMKEELNERLAEFSTSGDSLEEIQENREQIEIARHYEGLPKPMLVALHEFFDGKLYYRHMNE